MKTGLLLTLVMACSTGVTAQIYTDIDATGAADGSSWADAYTSINDAVEAAVDGDEIWIAAGTYLPVAPTANADTALYVDVSLSIYGGFDGTESTLDQRDADMHQVIITGDHAGDDVASNVTMNATDNNRHIFYVAADAGQVLIDGITIRNGKTLGVDGSNDERRAGGVLAYSPTTLRNVVFVECFGYFGGGFYPRGGGADNSIVDNCSFTNCEARFGGGIYMNCPSATVTACVFDDNRAGASGAGIYDNTGEGSMISMCSFSSNRTTEFRGAGIYISDSPATIMGCTFEDNSAQVSSGGGIQIRTADDVGEQVTSNIINCSFDRCLATFGAAIGVYDSLTIAMITGCTFTDNRADNVGGAISNAFGATTIVDDCFFDTNTALSSGGAIFLQNDFGTVNINNSTFDSNSANFGGALNISGTGDLGNTVSKLVLDNSVITNNVGAQQGGGINLNSVDADISNTLIARNINTEDTSVGGGISINSGDTTQVYVSIVNTTIADNEGSFLAGIAHFTGDVDGFSELTLQNTILANEDGGDNYTIEGGTPTLISNGGNLSTDNTTENEFTGMNDLIDADPEFLGEQGMRYHLDADSPCINTGVAAGAPTTDLLGRDRVQTIDKGAYEYQIVVNTAEQLATRGLQLYPNPVTDGVVYVSLAEVFAGEALLQVVDLQGRTVISKTINKSIGLEVVSLNLGSVPGGMYMLQIDNDGLTAAKPLIVR